MPTRIEHWRNTYGRPAIKIVIVGIFGLSVLTLLEMLWITVPIVAGFGGSGSWPSALSVIF
jgi:hypothetical protein